MATKNFTAKAFTTDFDKHWTVNSDEQPPALLVNPAASQGALLGAVQSRAERLHRTIFGWALNTSTECDACDLAGTLEPLAQEILILVEALSDAASSQSRTEATHV